MFWMVSGTKEEQAELTHLKGAARLRPFTFILIKAIYSIAAVAMGLAFYWKVFVDKIYSVGGGIGAGVLLLFCISCFIAVFQKNKSPDDQAL